MELCQNPEAESVFSSTCLRKGNLKDNCKRSRFKFLKDSYHNLKMGKGIPVEISNEPDKEWTDIKLNSVMAFFLEKVCI